MTINDQIKTKSYNMILIEKQPKYLPYHQESFINMNILLVKIIIEQARFTCSSFEKAFEKQIKTI